MNYSVFWRSKNELPRLESAVLNLCLVDSLLLLSELLKPWKLRIPTDCKQSPRLRVVSGYIFKGLKADSFLCIAVEILTSACQALFLATEEEIDFTYNIYYKPNCASNPIVSLKVILCRAFMVIKKGKRCCFNFSTQ